MNRNLAKVLVAVGAAALVIPFAAGCMSPTTRAVAPATPARCSSRPKPPEVEAQQLAATPAGQAAPAARGRGADDADDAGDLHARRRPTASGTDDYRCFLLDPRLDQDVWLTGSNVLPGNPEVVHHVILFKIAAGRGRRGRGQGRRRRRPGLDLLRRHRAGRGVPEPRRRQLAGRLGARWRRDQDVQDGYGVKLEAGSRIVMQVHYNLLKGAAPDESSAQLRWMPGDTDLTPLHTFLMPAPVELPVPGRPRRRPALRPRRRRGRREDALRRPPGNTNTLLHLLCGTDIVASRDHDLHPHDQPRR